MLLATAGYSPAHGAALLKLRLGLNLATARRAMHEAHAAMRVPVSTRLTAGLLQVACAEVSLDCTLRPASTAGTPDRAKRLSPDKKVNQNNRADADSRQADRLPKEWSIEEPNPLGRQVIEHGLYIFQGQTRANGKPLADLR